VSVRLIWAEAHNRVIGAGGGIPWHVPGEQALFRQRTSGSTVVMGRATWESLPRRPLPGRRNVVLTRDRHWRADGAEVAHSVEEVLAGGGDVWVIGGAAVYAAFLPYADEVVRTEIDLEVDGDACAPVLGDEWVATPGEWQTAANEVKFRVVDLRRPRGDAGDARPISWGA
jgi:dihydrofolate reductase